MSDITIQMDALQAKLDAMRATAAGVVPSLNTNQITANINPAAEPGYTTTEFWGMVATDILAIVALLHPGFHAGAPIVQASISSASGIATLGYAISRGLRKKGT